MDPKLYNISRALAGCAIDAHNARATFANLIDDREIISSVYDELSIGAKARTTVVKLAHNITKISLICYWRAGAANDIQIAHRFQGMEKSTSFERAVMATKACLKKMIKETNYQRRLQTTFSH